MKIIISDNQYSLLKESVAIKNIEAIKNHWKNQLKKGKKIRFDKDDLELWGITKTSDKIRTQIAFQEIVGDEVFAKNLIKPLLNKTFSFFHFVFVSSKVLRLDKGFAQPYPDLLSEVLMDPGLVVTH